MNLNTRFAFGSVTETTMATKTNSRSVGKGNANPLLRYLVLLTFGLLMTFAFIAKAKAIEIQEVTSASGIKAWLVEDYTVPIISLSLEFRGGSSTDPTGREGLSSVLTAMMDEGAGDLDTAALKAELEALGIEMGFSTDRDSVSGGMRLVRSDIDRAFELLAMVLQKPRFEEASLERVRAGFVSAAKRALTNPQAIMGTAMRESLFADHPYGRPSRGDVASLSAITRDDVINHHNMLMTRQNLVIGVVGAISPEQLSEKLDQTFAALPQKSDLPVIEEVQPKFGFREHIPFDSPQTLVSLSLPGKKRKDPDFFAAYLVNHILGGGSFSSRLYDEIREKRGLTYGISSSIATNDHAAYLGAGFGTRSDQAAQALDLMLAEIGKLAKEGPTAEELEMAKKFVIGSYAINNLDTSSKIADVLVGLQSSGLGKNYITDRVAFINSVTLEDTRRVAAEMLGSDPTIITIGPGDV